MLVELDPRVCVFNRNHGAQAVGRLDHTGPDLETLHCSPPSARQPGTAPYGRARYRNFQSISRLGLPSNCHPARCDILEPPWRGPSTSSASRSTSAATAAASTWGLGVPHRRPRRAAGGPGHPRGRSRRPGRADSGDQDHRRPEKKYIREIARVCERLYKTSLAVLEKGRIPIVLGGDHSLAAGSVAATADFAPPRRQAARPDLGRCARRHEHAGTSSSGNVHGMPLAALLGPEPAELSRIGGVLAQGHGRAAPSSSASATSTSARRNASATRACTSSR